MICKHIVELMHGQISVESAPGAGSTFRFHVRCLPTELAVNKPSTPVPLPQAHHSQRVLIVDDNPVNVRVAQAMLSRLGYKHDSETNGERALQAIARAEQEGAPYAIVLLDSHMPVMDGRATARALKASMGQRAPVMIGISASTLGSDRQQCLDAGMSDYLTKPLELARLSQVLQHWCNTAATPSNPSQPAGMPTPPSCLDAARWAELGDCEDATQSLRKAMVNDFINGLDAYHAAVREACQKPGCQGLYEAAHALKGSAENLGAYGLARHCAELESSAKQGAVPDRVLQAWETEVQTTRLALVTHLAKG